MLHDLFSKWKCLDIHCPNHQQSVLKKATLNRKLRGKYVHDRNAPGSRPTAIHNIHAMSSVDKTLQLT